MTITGVLHAAFEAQQVTERFRKRELVVELADQKYPQFVLFQLTGDRCDLLDEFRVGDQVAVEFHLRGREWTSPKGEVKYFNSLEVWTLKSASEGAREPVSEERPPLPDGPPGNFDDVPF